MKRLVIITLAVIGLSSCGDYKPYDGAAKAVQTRQNAETSDCQTRINYLNDYIDALETAVKTQRELDSVKAVVDSYYK